MKSRQAGGSGGSTHTTPRMQSSPSFAQHLNSSPSSPGGGSPGAAGRARPQSMAMGEVLLLSTIDFFPRRSTPSLFPLARLQSSFSSLYLSLGTLLQNWLTPSLYLSVSVSLYLSVSVSLYISIYLSLALSVYSALDSWKTISRSHQEGEEAERSNSGVASPTRDTR